MQTARTCLVILLLAAVVPPSGSQRYSMADDGEVAPAARKADDRQAAPQAGLAQKSLTKVREVFADGYEAAKAPQAKVDLARTLLDEAASTRDATDSWSLLNEALRLAVEGGDVRLANTAIDQLTAKYRIDSVKMRLDALTSMSAKATPKVAEEISRQALDLSQSSPEDAGETASAHQAKLLSLAIAMARKSQNKDLLVHVQQRQNELKSREKAERELDTVRAKLEQSPDDPDLKLELGSALCFRQGDWAAGLPLLAAGSDPTLSRLAMLEKRVDSADAILAAADGWSEWAGEQRGSSRSSAEQHAHDLYARIVDRLEGLDRTRVQRRMSSLGRGATAVGRAKSGPKSIPGLSLWLDASQPAPAAGGRAAGEARVPRWQDLSGGANDAVQTNEAAMPRLRTRAVEFDGGTFLVCPKPINASGMTIVVAYRATAATNDSSLASTRTASSAGWIIDHQGGDIYFRVFADDRTTQATFKPPAAEGNRILIASVSDTGEVRLQMVEGPSAVASMPLIPAASTTPLHVGAKTGNTGGTNFRGSISQFLIYRKCLTAEELTALIGWVRGTLP